MKININKMYRSLNSFTMIPLLHTRKLQWLLAVCFLVFTLGVNAQMVKIKTAAELSVGDDPTKGISATTDKTLICAENTGFTLKSTKTDGAVPTANSYTSWAWTELDETGAPKPLPTGVTAVNEALTVTAAAATPGWHTYQVIAGTGTTECPADAVLFTVYVLPKLTVTTTVDQTNNPVLTYCAANGAPTGNVAGNQAIKLKSEVKFETTPRAIAGLSLKTFTLDDFDLTYTWYKVEVGTTTKIPVTGTDADYTIVDPAVSTVGGTEKKYNYGVQVAYTAKTCGEYTAITTGADAAPAVITVTPKANKPVITIE